MLPSKLHFPPAAFIPAASNGAQFKGHRWDELPGAGAGLRRQHAGNHLRRAWGCKLRFWKSDADAGLADVPHRDGDVIWETTICGDHARHRHAKTSRRKHLLRPR